MKNRQHDNQYNSGKKTQKGEEDTHRVCGAAAAGHLRGKTGDELHVRDPIRVPTAIHHRGMRRWDTMVVNAHK